jgi:hypothetical protein
VVEGKAGELLSGLTNMPPINTEDECSMGQRYRARLFFDGVQRCHLALCCLGVLQRVVILLFAPLRAVTLCSFVFEFA